MSEHKPSQSDLLIPSSRHPVIPSSLTAWLALVWFSLRRQARARYMVWIALGLLVFSLVLVSLWALRSSWSPRYWRTPPGNDLRNQELTWVVPTLLGAVSKSPWTDGVSQAVMAGGLRALFEPRLMVFTQSVVFLIFISFLLPLWSLSFATESFGGEKETRSIVWLLTRPLPRPAIYLAKFVALLPWSLGLNLGGFALLCMVGGGPGWEALALFWPAVLWGTLAFSALFFLIGAVFRRPAVVSIVYSFFLETLLGNMPGYLKRISITFYVRCMMLDAAQKHIEAAGGVFQPPEKPEIYLPVDAMTAWLVLITVTVGLLAAGMVLFSRTEYVTVE